MTMFESYVFSTVIHNRYIHVYLSLYDMLCTLSHIKYPDKHIRDIPIVTYGVHVYSTLLYR